MKLLTLIRTASDSYPDGKVLESHQSTKARGDGRVGDTLAEFIAREIAETYEPQMKSQWHLQRAIEVMEKAHQEIGAVLSGLRRRLERTPYQPDASALAAEAAADRADHQRDILRDKAGS